MRLVKYIGTKSLQVDRLYGTRTVWSGAGDVQEIDDDESAERMCRNHPDTYALIERDGTTPTPTPLGALDHPAESVLRTTTITLENGKVVSLIDAPRRVLAEYARNEHGLAVTDGHTKSDILTFIANIEELREGTTDAPPASKVEGDPAAAPASGDPAGWGLPPLPPAGEDSADAA